MDKSLASKLFKLKKWLTLPEAAKHLTGVCNEEITKADILRLALDGHLKLSVYFVNKAYVRPGKVVGYEDVKWGELPAEMTVDMKRLPPEARGKPLPYIRSLKINDDKYLNLEEKVVVIEGVWDLPMIGGDHLDVEHEWQNLTGGPAVTLHSMDGAFVEGRDGVMCQLQESFDQNEYQAGSKAQLEELKRSITSNNISKEKAEELLNQHEEDRKKYLEKKRSHSHYDDYYPASGLPEDSVLVVRTDALREFEQLISYGESERNATACSTPNKSALPQDKSTQLRALNQASSLWSNADRDDKTTWTDTKDVIAFLVDKGFSQTLAVRGASIVRPDWAESGARPKE
ncbi:MAG: hypothetical protein ACXW01_15165 [Methylobacter sp.]